MTTLVYAATALRLAAMRDRVVSVVAILAGTAVVLGAFTLVGWLIVAGHGSEALIGLLGTALLAYLEMIRSNVRQVKQQVTTPDPSAESPISKSP